MLAPGTSLWHALHKVPRMCFMYRVLHGPSVARPDQLTTGSASTMGLHRPSLSPNWAAATTDHASVAKCPEEHASVRTPLATTLPHPPPCKHCPPFCLRPCGSATSCREVQRDHVHCNIGSAPTLPGSHSLAARIMWPRFDLIGARPRAPEPFCRSDAAACHPRRCACGVRPNAPTGATHVPEA